MALRFASVRELHDKTLEILGCLTGSFHGSGGGDGSSLLRHGGKGAG